MWDLALERLGNGAPVAYERCVEASIGRPPSPSRPEEKRARLALKWEDLDLLEVHEAFAGQVLSTIAAIETSGHRS